MSKDYFEYYCGAEGDQFSFIRIPKLMLFDAKFEDLSLGALMLYGLLLDRMSLSIRHGWIDENNHVYIRYKIKDIMDNLHLSENTATKYLNELENIGLVEKLKIGMGQGNVLYVKNFITPDLRDKALITTKICGNGEIDYYSKKLGKPKKLQIGQKSDALKASKIDITAENGGNGTADFGVFDTAENGANETVNFVEHSKNEFKNNKYNNTQSNQSSADKMFTIYRHRASRKYGEERIDGYDRAMIFRAGLMDQIEYDELKYDYPSDSMIDEILETMVEFMLSTTPTIKISGNEYSSDYVRSRIMRTYRTHVEYMIESLKNNNTKVSNIKGYLKTTVFNALTTMESYYQANFNSSYYG